MSCENVSRTDVRCGRPALEGVKFCQTHVIFERQMACDGFDFLTDAKCSRHIILGTKFCPHHTSIKEREFHNERRRTQNRVCVLCDELTLNVRGFCTAHLPKLCGVNGCNDLPEKDHPFCSQHSSARKCMKEECHLDSEEHEFCGQHAKRCGSGKCKSMCVENTNLCSHHTKLRDAGAERRKAADEEGNRKRAEAEQKRAEAERAKHAHARSIIDVLTPIQKIAFHRLNDQHKRTVLKAIVDFGLTFPCSQMMINKSFRNLSLQHHPDKGGSEAKMSEISDMRDTLFKIVLD